MNVKLIAIKLQINEENPPESKRIINPSLNKTSNQNWQSTMMK